MDKSFDLATFQEALLLISIKHLYKGSQASGNLVQSYQLEKIIHSSTLDYLAVFNPTNHQ